MSAFLYTHALGHVRYRAPRPCHSSAERPYVRITSPIPKNAYSQIQQFLRSYNHNLLCHIHWNLCENLSIFIGDMKENKLGVFIAVRRFRRRHSTTEIHRKIYYKSHEVKWQRLETQGMDTALKLQEGCRSCCPHICKLYGVLSQLFVSTAHVHCVSKTSLMLRNLFNISLHTMSMLLTTLESHKSKFVNSYKKQQVKMDRIMCDKKCKHRMSCV